MSRPTLHDCSHEDRQQALRQAANLLDAVWPKRQLWGNWNSGGACHQVIYTRESTGALRVTHRISGALIAQSMPAPLLVLDPELFPPACSTDGDEQAFMAVAECIGPGSTLAALVLQLERPPLRSLTVPELAYVLGEWAQRLRDEG